MKTAICEMLDIDFPLLAFSHCRDVVAAVTNAGGFGVLGASSHGPEDLEHELAWIDDHVGGHQARLIGGAFRLDIGQQGTRGLCQFMPQG